MIKIAIASDHAGFELKKFIIDTLFNQYEINDFGCFSEQSVDYPDYAQLVANDILINKSKFGILICGTGIGMSIAANKFNGIRAALCHNSLEARLTRQHNDANIICLGARIIGREIALDNVKTFLNTDFSHEEKHQIRINKIKNYE